MTTLCPIAPRAILLTTVGTLMTACEEPGPDAYGSFESVEVAVAAEATGPLVRLDLEEGSVLAQGQLVGQVDTVQLSLQHRELEIQREASRTRGVEAAAAVRSLQAQLRSAEADLERTQRLFSAEVATASELSRLQANVESLEAQIDGARARVALARHDGDAIGARIDQLRDRVARAAIENPVAGTVLTTFAEAGEFVQQGRTLYAIAPLDTLVLRAYVSGGQLSALELGAEVDVQFDDRGGTLGVRSGRVTWISAEAEFTPTPIQTREERVDQVYAVKVRVPNEDGRLKIGMPGEILFSAAAPGS